MITQIVIAFIYTAIVNLLRKELKRKNPVYHIFLKEEEKESRNKLSAEGKYKNTEDNTR